MNTQEGILEPHPGEPGCKQTEEKEIRNIQPQVSQARRRSRECCWLRGQRGSDQPDAFPFPAHGMMMPRGASNFPPLKI